ncbi:unnamed protein product [Brassica oleracea]
MSSSSDPSKTGMERKKKGAPIKFLVPLIYAPALPLIRLTLRHQPVLRDRLFGLVLAGAFAHGFYLVYPLFFFFLPSCLIFNFYYSSLASKTCISAFVFLSEDLVEKMYFRVLGLILQ